MSDYTHRMSLVVPQSFMPQANQLALIAGESPDDYKTFTQANWQDKEGNLYAVCSTVIKPIVLSMFGADIGAESLPKHASGADAKKAQEALNIAVMYEAGMKVTTDKIVIIIDIDPVTAFKILGLTLVPISDLEGAY